MLLAIHNLNFWVCIRLIFSSNAQIGKDGKLKTHIHLLIYPSIVWCDLKLYFQMSLKAFEGTNVLFDSIKNENDQHYWKKKERTKHFYTETGREKSLFHFQMMSIRISLCHYETLWLSNRNTISCLSDKTLFFSTPWAKYPLFFFFFFLLKGNIQYWLNKPPSVLYLLGFFWM